jgi:hypothetical protein
VKVAMPLFYAALLMLATMTTQAKPAQAKPAAKKSAPDAQALQWIAKLKDSPLPDMEAGMPDKTFGKWFTEMARPGVPHYVVKECGAPSTDEKSKGPMCVVASAKVSRVRRLELTFAVLEGERTAQSDKNPEARQTSWRFLVGSVEPSDPRLKVSTRVITRLSDLPPLVRQRREPCSFCKT